KTKTFVIEMSKKKIQDLEFNENKEHNGDNEEELLNNNNKMLDFKNIRNMDTKNFSLLNLNEAVSPNNFPKRRIITRVSSGAFDKTRTIESIAPEKRKKNIFGNIKKKMTARKESEERKLNS